MRLVWITADARKIKLLNNSEILQNWNICLLVWIDVQTRQHLVSRDACILRPFITCSQWNAFDPTTHTWKREHVGSVRIRANHRGSFSVRRDSSFSSECILYARMRSPATSSRIDLSYYPPEYGAQISRKQICINYGNFCHFCAYIMADINNKCLNGKPIVYNITNVCLW